MGIQFTDSSGNSTFWAVSVGTTWLLRNGGRKALVGLGSQLELCYECCY
jgi:hypothetical protein